MKQGLILLLVGLTLTSIDTSASEVSSTTITFNSKNLCLKTIPEHEEECAGEPEEESEDAKNVKQILQFFR